MQSAVHSARSRWVTAIFFVGVALVATGAIGIVFESLPGTSLPDSILQLDLYVGLLGLVLSLGSILNERGSPDSRWLCPGSVDAEEQPIFPVYATRDLVEVLLSLARDSEPESLSVGLAITPAGQLEAADEVPPELPVFTHVYLPERLNSVSAVFGIDLETPPGRTQGRFVTHRSMDLRLTERDDFHEIVFVAVPPWDIESIAAFDRRGRRHPLHLLDAEPLVESLPDGESIPF